MENQKQLTQEKFETIKNIVMLGLVSQAYVQEAGGNLDDVFTTEEQMQLMMILMGAAVSGVDDENFKKMFQEEVRRLFDLVS